MRYKYLKRLKAKKKASDAEQRRTGMGYRNNIKKSHVGLGVVRTIMNAIEARELARTKSSGASSSVHPESHTHTQKILMVLEP